MTGLSHINILRVRFGFCLNLRSPFPAEKHGCSEASGLKSDGLKRGFTSNSVSEIPNAIAPFPHPSRVGLPRQSSAFSPRLCKSGVIKPINVFVKVTQRLPIFCYNPRRLYLLCVTRRLCCAGCGHGARLILRRELCSMLRFAKSERRSRAGKFTAWNASLTSTPPWQG